MKTILIDPLIQQIKACVDRHNLGTPGAYCRYSMTAEETPSVNEYGVADAANILYTIGEFTQPQQDRQHWIDVLQKLQDPQSGMYHEQTHHPIHTTAHCTAALELFDAVPLYPCHELEDCLTKEGLYHRLETGIRWETHPWRDSHIGAGVLVCLTNAGQVGLEWKNWYFDWYYEHTDPETGFPFFGAVKKAPLYEYMAGGFHYFFNHEAEHRPMRYPEKVIDSCLQLMKSTDGPFMKHCGFIEIDVVYCLTRAMRQSPHRFHEAKAALEDFAEEFFDMLLHLDYEGDRLFNDLHSLFGSVCCMAELQSALPGKIISSRPLRLVLDRRPFI